MTIPASLAILPIKGRVFMPGMSIRLKISKPSIARLIEEKITSSQSRTVPIALAVVTIENEADNEDDPREESLHRIGCAVRILRAERSMNTKDQFNVFLEGVARIRIVSLTQTRPHLVATIEHIPEPSSPKGDKDFDAQVASFKAGCKEYVDLLHELKLPEPVVNPMRKYIEASAPGQLADFICSALDISVQERLKVMDSIDLRTRMDVTKTLLKNQLMILKVQTQVSTAVEAKLNKKQRELFLRQQLKAIKEELNEKDDGPEDELEALEKKLENAGLPEEVEKVAQREIKRLRKIPPAQAEFTVLKIFLDWISDIPWNISTTDTLDIEKARTMLNTDHYGLEKVKKRILEYLAVKKLKNDIKGPILCLVGPPGVGKTSLGKTIADALGRKFHRMALGGVRDEAEIRGHRRTYIGALPGRIVQGLKRAGTNNPVILLDEIDKLGKDIRGDPASALLEVLDAEQNNSFTDHYLGVNLDLSKVLFIATANGIDGIPPPLLDRMEMIQLPGYTTEEKLEIAKAHLVPRQIKKHGIQPSSIEFTEEGLLKIISNYTREAGVRNLEREIAAICRNVAVEVVERGDKNTFLITPELVSKILGPEVFEEDLTERMSIPGIVAGLAWTAAGGGLLFIEVSKMPGKGELRLTGQLGDVIKESAMAAVSWVRANSTVLGLTSSSKESIFDKTDIHIHFPAGAVPKDGPSAGVTIVTALVSLFSDKIVRPATAMTGEITLRGLVLPVGGIKEKVLAAYRNGIKRVILPYRNRKDLVEIPKSVQKDMEIILVKNIQDVLKAAFNEEDSVFMDYTPSHL